MKTTIPLLALAAAAALLAPAPAQAADPAQKECLREARSDLRECQRTCRDEFLSASDLCRSLDPACMSLCRETRAACSAGPRSVRDDRIRTCNDVQRRAIQECRTRYPDDREARNRCVDSAQIAGFICRDDARESVAEELGACREEFRHCVEGCSES